jgi:hypothetical protein
LALLAGLSADSAPFNELVNAAETVAQYGYYRAFDSLTGPKKDCSLLCQGSDGEEKLRFFVVVCDSFVKSVALPL